MRILVTIPHYYEAKAAAGHGSEKAEAETRIEALRGAIAALLQTFGPAQRHLHGQQIRPCNELFAAHVDIVVCTTGNLHLVHALPPTLFRHHATQANPRLLGYECHAVLAAQLGSYDYFCYLEDDLAITDPLFFVKLAWFTQAAGAEAVLQPNRFELSAAPPVHKLLIDGPLVDGSISPRFQDRSIRPVLKARLFNQELTFARPDNPHAGCFFLDAMQMDRWSRQPYFMDRADGFWGPLESAATLGLMRTFRVYKPAPINAGFLEIQHLDNRYLGRLRFL